MMYERGWVWEQQQGPEKGDVGCGARGEDSTGHLCLVGAQVDVGKSKEREA